MSSRSRQVLNLPEAEHPKQYENSNKRMEMETRFRLGAVQDFERTIGSRSCSNRCWIIQTPSFVGRPDVVTKGEQLLVLISSDHQLFKNKGGNVPFTTNFLESIAIDPKRPETFKKWIYFGLTMIVASNPSQHNLKDGNMTLDEVRNLCTQHGGGIHLKMKNNFSHLFLSSMILLNTARLVSFTLRHRFKEWHI